MARDVANAYTLDFHYVGAKPRQHLATSWSGLYAGEVDNLDSFQWQFHDQTLLIGKRLPLVTLPFTMTLPSGDGVTAGFLSAGLRQAARDR